MYGRASTRVSFLGRDGTPCAAPFIRTEYALPRPWGWQRLYVWRRFERGPPVRIEAEPRVASYPAKLALLQEAMQADIRVPLMVQQWGARWPESLVTRDLTLVRKI